MKVGLTGAIASGKSVVGEMFVALGAFDLLEKYEVSALQYEVRPAIVLS